MHKSLNVFFQFITNIYYTYRAAAGLSPPYVTYIEDNCTTKGCFQGMFADVWHELSEKMNFTYTIRKMTVWGALNNGSWNGMIGTSIKHIKLYNLYFHQIIFIIYSV